jgi:hypothetical protein
MEIAHGSHWIGGSVGPRTGLNDVEKRRFLALPRLELRSLGRRARSQSLYRLRYPSFALGILELENIYSHIQIFHYYIIRHKYGRTTVQVLYGQTQNCQYG